MTERIEDPEVLKSVEVGLANIDSLNQILKKLEWHIEKTARSHDYHTLYLLRSIPVIGQILALVILYCRRFPTSAHYTDFLSTDDRILPLARVPPQLDGSPKTSKPTTLIAPGQGHEIYSEAVLRQHAYCQRAS